MAFEKLKQLFSKNKHMQSIYIILIIGVTLLFFTSSLFVKDGAKKTKEGDAPPVSTAVDAALQNDLEKILSQIAGAGEVSVMITYEGTGEKYYAADVTSESTSSSDSAQAEKSRTQESAKQSTKLITPSNEPVITKENFPKVQGVIVVCDGARDAQVRQDVITAVKAALNVADHKVSVFARK